jgi:hypothetical protein
MIRQLGPQMFFVTFISAESKWIDLVEILHEYKNYNNICNTNIQHEGGHL